MEDRYENLEDPTHHHGSERQDGHQYEFETQEDNDHHGSGLKFYDETPEQSFAEELGGNETTRSTKPRDVELDAYSSLLSQQMAMNKLQESMRVYDTDLLQRALDEYQTLGMERDATLKTAEKKYACIVECRDELRQAMEERNVKAIEAALARTKSYKVENYLRKEVMDAKVLLDELLVKEQKYNILAMDKKTMAEIRSYSKPSPLVHRIMSAALLLMREDEGSTAKWSKCQSLCNPDGPTGMVRRMMRFESSTVDPWIIERVRVLLKDIQLVQAQKASPGAATFFVWAKGIIGPDPDNDQEEPDSEEGGKLTSDSDAGAGYQTNRTAGSGRAGGPASGTAVVDQQRIIQREMRIFARQKRLETTTKKTGNTAELNHTYYKYL